MTDRIEAKNPFRHYIREWMEVKSLSQEHLARCLEIEASTVSKLLNGRMRMSDKWLSGFAEALHVEVIDLLRDPNRPSDTELLDGLNEEQRLIVLNLINLLRKSG